jgi:molecular chaperone GrpE
MSEKKKIVIPTQEEVAEYCGQANPANDPPGDSDSANAPGSGADGAMDNPRSATQATAGEQPRSEADEYKDKYLRAVAELSNYRKRAEKDRQDSLRYANAGLVKSLLPVLDNLQRVVASANEHPENTAAVVDGVKLTIDAFRKALAEHHVVPIEAEGQTFDPAVHEAMMQQPSAEHDTPTVLQALQEGFKLFDRVIRPARVVVSKPADPKQS